MSETDLFSVVTVGHVDHGKSTIVGRLLADTGSLPEGKLEQVRAYCARNAKPFEYAFLLDALKEEQSQGITIDTARVFFRTALRNYLLFDAPGHVEFLKNMVTGSARADAALVVIDAREGIQANSLRHGYLLSFLGIKQLVVLVNKMDLVDYAESVYRSLVEEYGAFLNTLGVTAQAFIPIAGFHGHNVVHTAEEQIPWYGGDTVIRALDRFRALKPPAGLPFRMPVQDVYKFTEKGDDRRIIAGTVECGAVSAGDELCFHPSGTRGTVKSIEVFSGGPIETVEAGHATGFTLKEPLYIKRGEVATRVGELQPRSATRLRANVFWLGREPLTTGRDYLVRVGTARSSARVEEVTRVLDAARLGVPEPKDRIDRNEVGEVILRLARPIAVDLASDIPALGRFVIVSDFEIQGGGIVLETLTDAVAWMHDEVAQRDLKWEGSAVPPVERQQRLGHASAAILISGGEGSRRKDIARLLERQLFDQRVSAYYLGMSSLKYGVDADLLGRSDPGMEHMRRLAELAYVLTNAGLVLIVTARDLTQDAVELVRTAIQPVPVLTVWAGSAAATCRADLVFDGTADDEVARAVRSRLETAGVTPGGVVK